MMPELLASLAGDLLTGANLPFFASFLLAVLFTLLSVLGVGHTDADVGADADFDHDVDLEVDHDIELDAGLDHDVEMGHDVEMDHDVDLDHDVEADVTHDHDLDHDADVDAHHAVTALTLNDVLYFFGIGKVPLSILLMSFSYAFSVVGWLLNTIVARPDGEVGSWFTASLLGALVAGLLAMRLVSTVISSVMPTKDVSGFARRQLVGLRGVVGLPVDEHGGRAQVTDPEGTRHLVRCRTVPGGKQLPKGAKIIVVKYLAEDDLYYVAADRRR